MLLYLLKRMLYFIPTLLLIAITVFFLSKLIGEELQCINEPIYDEQRCIEEATEKGFNKPLFYFNITTAAHPDTLHKIIQEERRITLKKLIGQHGNWEPIQQYYQQVRLLDKDLLATNKRSEALIKMKTAIKTLYTNYKSDPIEAQLAHLISAAKDSTALEFQPLVNTLNKKYQAMHLQATPYTLLIPQINWYGADNQFHRWFSNFIKGNWGQSKRDSKQVIDKITARLPWTLAITIPAIFLAYILSIPIGIYTAVYKDSKLDQRLSTVLLLIYSLPLFWIGTLAVMLFTTPEYGMKIFPSIWLASLSNDTSIWSQIGNNFTRLILPVICLMYGSLAFISRQLRSSMVETLQQNYIQTARAKGLSESKVIWKHAFRNALFPLITIFANVLPAAFAGSLVVEYVFNIQGMGYLLFDSIRNNDWQVVYVIIMIAAVLTIIGILLADLLYALADPRVRYEKK